MATGSQDVQFGDKVEVLVPPGERSKLSACSWTGTYLGPVGSGISNHHILIQGHIIVMQALMTNTMSDHPPSATSNVTPTTKVLPAAHMPTLNEPGQTGNGQPHKLTVDQSGVLAPFMLMSNIEQAAQDHPEHECHVAVTCATCVLARC